jgi:minor extracellular serine protease Vpr
MNSFSRLILIAFAVPLLAAPPDRTAGRYALILEDPPAAVVAAQSKGITPRAAEDHSRRIEAAQATLRKNLEQRGIQPTGAVQVLLNAIFLRCAPERLQELRFLPGVKGVVPLPELKLKLNAAVPAANGPAAWNLLGGVGSAGAGVKIAVIDTGIDYQHPAFQDESLPLPEGYPKCAGSDCAFTNHKVIAARSYVHLIAAGTAPNPAADSRPDDLSPRDRVGHGTAVATATAGWTSTGPLGTITGMAPKAYLGNYKVFGSPGVNDGTSGGAVISALEDAWKDGMDIAVLSLGGSAFTGPLDEGAACGAPPGVPCDPLARAVENAVLAGLTVVTAAGNEGNDGQKSPTLNSVSSPATAPSAIAVGAVSSPRTFTSSVRVAGGAVPENLGVIPAVFGDGPALSRTLTAPLRDITKLGDNTGLACSANLPLESLRGALALIQRGNCLFLVKLLNAQQAGAVGVVFYQQDGVDDLIRPGGLTGTALPAVMIGNTAGRALKQYLASNADAPVTLDPSLMAVSGGAGNTMAAFSSRGPSAGESAIKPEIVATGTTMYMGTQKFDPNGVMYDASGFTVAQGTSFSAPLVAGAAALVKQKNPGFGPAQLKSAVVNTATADATDGGAPAGAIAQGGGRLDARTAVQAGFTAEPSTLSFGVLRSRSLPPTQGLTLRNHGTAPLALTLSVTPSGLLSLDRTAVTIAPGQSANVLATLSGALPPAGSYEGAVSIQGGATTLHVPYLYLVGDGVGYNLLVLSGSGFVGVVDGAVPGRGLAFKLTDQYGVPVQGAPVQFSVARGGGAIRAADLQTDAYGVATAQAVLGPANGIQQFSAVSGGLTALFSGGARVRPTIQINGIVNAASFEVGAGAAPGSYVSIFGTALSDEILSAPSASLPVSLSNVSVSFDVPSANLSLPGRLHLVAPGQVNVQVPWELLGQTSVLVKVSIGDVSSEVYTLPLAEYSPGVFEYQVSGETLAAALDENYAVVGGGNPVARTKRVQLFLNGLGPVDHEQATGEPAPVDPLARTTATPEVTIGGVKATVEFSGLAPLFAGLYQVNVVVPGDAPTGIQPLVVTVNGVRAKTSKLAIQ